MTYIFGLVNADLQDVCTAIEGCSGLASAPQVAQVGGWALVWEEMEAQEIMPRRRLMLAHTRVVEAMMQSGTVLPARFGLLADDLGRITDLISRRHALIAAEFTRLDGCIELGVRVRFGKEAALRDTLRRSDALTRERDNLMGAGAEAHFARAEFGRKLSEALDQRRGAAQKAILAMLKPLARDHVLRAPDDEAEVLRAEFLLSQPDQDQFIIAVGDAAEACGFDDAGEPQISIIGPAPVYNFVRLSLETGTDEAAA